MKKVQIDYELFRKLIFYHLGSDDQYEEDIRNGLEEKLDALVRHELYTKYKTAPSEEEQEKARQEYLDKRGVTASYRLLALSSTSACPKSCGSSNNTLAVFLSILRLVRISSTPI